MVPFQLARLEETFKGIVLTPQNIKFRHALIYKFDETSSGKAVYEDRETLGLMHLISYMKALPIGDVLTAADNNPSKEKPAVEFQKAEKTEKELRLTEKQITDIVIDNAYNRITEWIGAKDWEGAALAMWVIEKLDPDNPGLREIKKGINGEILFKSSKSKGVLKPVTISGLKKNSPVLTPRDKQREIARLLNAIRPQFELVYTQKSNEDLLSTLKELFCLRGYIREKEKLYINHYIYVPEFNDKVRWLSSIIMSFIEGRNKIISPEVFKKIGIKASKSSPKDRLKGDSGWVGTSGQDEEIWDEEEEGMGGPEEDLLDIDWTPLVKKPSRAVGASN